MTGQKTWLWWSSGKDSAWTLHTLNRDPDYAVEALVTTVNTASDQVAVHAVPRQLLRAQAVALGRRLHEVEIPYPCPNAVYEAAVAEVVAEARREQVTHMAFGDLFLADIRAYREGLLASSPVEAVFPLWLKDTTSLASAMIDGGLEARLICVNTRVLDASFAGRRFDRELLDALPDGVDPCGENGEFHTFVTNGPGFSAGLRVKPGEVTTQGDFAYCALQPADQRHLT